jgi:mxaJ protein
VAGGASAQELKAVRVCADPDNLPFSNQQQQGFENKIAELLARDLGVPLAYYWWPHQRGLVRNTLRAEKCDVLVGVPKSYDLVLTTRPYYRSTYALVYPSTNGRRITSLDDPFLRQAKIGVHQGTPPHHVLAERGILDNVVTYGLFFDHRVADPRSRPGAPVDDVRAGRLDAAIVWGPLAGYAATKGGASDLAVVPLAENGPIPFSFDVAMGVKKGAKELKARLDQFLDRRDAEIRKILDSYGVPRVAASVPGSQEPVPSGPAR